MGPGPVQMRLVEEAYQVLSDPLRREVYVLVRQGLTRRGLPIAAASAQSKPRAAHTTARGY